ncbi:helix-turn-helix domain-containing protein [Clostridium oceanicum]|uniref:Helix-turn-helix domain-containing protein n=1 Tax=Clostridium oceanicum TaxID=1543 RepID=A0ABP3V1X0_9CLOT
MPREYTEYKDKLPIDICFSEIIKYPIHWHNSLEIIYVVEGSIKIIIETETHKVSTNEIEIINPDEAHSIEKITAKNKVLIFYINPLFLNRYYDIENRFFYTDFSAKNSQTDEKYLNLRKYLSILLCEFVQRTEDYKENLEKNLVELLYYLVNNFHYLIYDEEDLKDNEIQFERYDRIIKYIYSNYHSKIRLRDLARKEFLSTHYLSTEMKNKVGYSFNDFLNLTRVEESIKLLLDTDKNISEISEELGFSHIRYFNKHFKKHYKCTPTQYRKKYKLDLISYKKSKEISKLPLKNSLKDLRFYLESYHRFQYKGRIIKINVDVSSDYIEFNNVFNYSINIGNYKNMLKNENYYLLKEFQKHIQSEFVILNNIFPKTTKCFFKNEDDFLDWYEVKMALEYLNKLGLKPNIIINDYIKNNKNFIFMLKEFILYFKNIFGKYEFEKWKFSLVYNIPDELKINIIKVLEENKINYNIIKHSKKNNKVNKVYDTLYMLPYIIDNYLNKKDDLEFLTLFDEFSYNNYIDNELFCGGYGLINRQEMKKSSYYAYCFLSKLGNNILCKGDNYIITENKDEIQILLYSYDRRLGKIVNSKDLRNSDIYNKNTQKNFSINLSALESDYKVVMYKMDEKTGDLYSNWLKIGNPKRILKEDKNILLKSSTPHISLDFVKQTNIYNIICKINGLGAVLICMKKVQKHLK